MTRGLGPERSRILSFIQVVQHADPDINSHNILKPNYSKHIEYILIFQSRSNTIFSLKPRYNKQIEYISFYLDRRRDLKREKSQCSGSSILTVPHGYLKDRKKEKIFKGDGWPIRDNRKSFLLSSPHLLSLPNINNCVTPHYSKRCLCRFFLSWSIRR